MSERTSINDFGLLIAFVIPGFTALWGTQPLLQSAEWMPWGVDPSVGDFLFSTIVSVGAGLTVSTIRWCLIDTLHHRTGVRPPTMDFSRLGDRTSAFAILLDSHYRFYQYYGGMQVALAWTFVAHHIASGTLWDLGGFDAAIVVGIALFFLGSRDSLRKYYSRTGELLRNPRKRRLRLGAVNK